MASPKAAFAAARAKRPALDHLVRAASRYQADTGDRLAAAVTFFGFLSFFPLLAATASLLAIVLGPSAVTTVAQQVDAFSPGLAEQLGLEDLLSENSAAVGLTGLISLAGLLYAGLGWVDALREAVRTMWHQNVKAGNIVKKKLADIVILAGLGVTLLLTVGVSAAAGAFSGVALDLVGLQDSFVATAFLKVLGTALALLTSTLLFLYLFVRLPKVQTPWRRIIKGALLAAVLFEVLKRVGAIYIERTTENPLYGAFAVIVGLLVWMNLVSRMLLFCAAWTVTAPYDSDVAPSGTANPEQARKAGIPQEFADDDPDDPPAVQEDGAPSPLTAALQGKTPPQDQPAGRPGRQESDAVAARRATDGGGRTGSAAHSAARSSAGRSGAAGPSDAASRSDAAGPASAGTGTAVLPGQDTAKKAAQFSAGAIGVSLAAVAVYALRTLTGALRR